ncbi:regulatory helix-turn-helix LysR family protein [Cricetibacter osteomyelitidis]|uniref:Regulatory helix-turn-helix LysR family protein n=1 Tax=Cricetibacter osteomyelitidis TaxID=1521931 RepID=A0A4R2T8W9_9PAST|nr:LysR family transcriptional regulator [Cricetibacter osteomyelitidis]TCP97314.1 regulatory helix-turn-helix LysR family protein [Cricetibacter osteomyelitidis]
MQSSTFGQLNIFHAIVAAGSIIGASRLLGIASPSISQALKLLEQHIGLPLFQRSTRKMTLTEAGQRLYDDTKYLVSSLDYALEGVKALKEQPPVRCG